MGYKVVPIVKEVVVDEVCGHIFKQKETRFIIVDDETGEVLDDAQGYGYKKVVNAHKAWRYKHRTPEEVIKQKGIQRWLHNHKEFVSEYEDILFYCLKCGESVTHNDIEELMKRLGIFDECPYTINEIISGLKRYK